MSNFFGKTGKKTVLLQGVFMIKVQNPPEKVVMTLNQVYKDLFKFAIHSPKLPKL